MTNNPESVTVEQGDRLAAWQHRPSCYKVDDYASWMAGKYDMAAPVIQAFAAHRRAALSKPTPVEAGLREAQRGFEMIHNSLMSNGPKQASGEIAKHWLDWSTTILAALSETLPQEPRT